MDSVCYYFLDMSKLDWLCGQIAALSSGGSRFDHDNLRKPLEEYAALGSRGMGDLVNQVTGSAERPPRGTLPFLPSYCMLLRATFTSFCSEYLVANGYRLHHL